MDWRRITSGLSCFLSLAISLALAADAHAAHRADGRFGDEPFPRPPALHARIEFWKQIFTRYRQHEVVIHDSTYVEKVYAVLDLRGASKKRIAAVSNAEKKRLRAILLGLDTRAATPGAALSAEEREILALFDDVEAPGKFRAAADRLRGQTGLREPFEEGVRASRQYLPEMEAIFRAEGLPPELTRVPFIESCFNLRAYSWKGAAGVWQFMPRTGRLHGLRIDPLVDERRDPLRATHAAAAYLRAAYAELGSWPLAITSYNHGVYGIARGVRTVGSADVVALVERYEGRGFGFAGRNFYVEFLAALEVDRAAEQYFGPFEHEAPIETTDVVLARAVGIDSAARSAGLSRAELLTHNPALGRRVATGAAAVPRGYRLRVPAGGADASERQFAAADAAPAVEREMTEPTGPGVHRVRRGESLWEIARQYGTSVDGILAENNVADARRVTPGQRLRIPGAAGPPRLAATVDSTGTMPSAAAPPADTGDAAVATIAPPVVEMAAASPAVIGESAAVGPTDPRPTQPLTLLAPMTIASVAAADLGAPVAGAFAPRTGWPEVIQGGEREHRVRRGQTLSHIARRYGVGVAALQAFNDLRDGRHLRPGQLIRVPPTATTVVGVGASVPAPMTESAPAEIRHRVKRGQTLSHIARAYGTSVDAIKRHNGIRDARAIRTGQVIRVPGRGESPAPGPAPEVTVVPSPLDRGWTAGETPWQIAQQCGTSLGASRLLHAAGTGRCAGWRHPIKLPPS